MLGSVVQTNNGDRPGNKVSFRKKSELRMCYCHCNKFWNAVVLMNRLSWKLSVCGCNIINALEAWFDVSVFNFFMPLIFDNTCEVHILLDVFLPLLSVACHSWMHSRTCLHAFLKASTPPHWSFFSFIRKDVELAVTLAAIRANRALGCVSKSIASKLRDRITSPCSC